MTTSESQEVAFLGPSGSFSEIAMNSWGKNTEARSCYSIPEVFRLVDQGEVESGFVPIENMLQGPVTETLDLLLEYGDRLYMADSHVEPIKLALGALPAASGRGLRKFQRVLSRSEPLHQSSLFLRENLPQVLWCPTSSSSAAMQQLVETQDLDSVVVGAAASIRKHGLTVLKDNIANTSDNQTRFVLIRRGNALNVAKVEPQPSLADTHFVTSLAVCPGRDRSGLLYEILEVISIENGTNLLSIHSRPDSRGGFVFFLELEGHLNDAHIVRALKGLEDYCKHTTGDTARIVVFGAYPKAAFAKQLLKKVGIIGGNGEMGRWFSNFFQSAGFETSTFDLDSTVSLETFVKDVEVVLLSVPMPSIESLAQALIPLLSKAHLVVENCSIKNSALPLLLDKLPADVEVLGMHTMFGGNLKSLRDQNVIFTRTLRSDIKATKFEDVFYKHGARVSHASLEEHDKVVAFVQSLVHLVATAFGETISKHFDSEQELEPYATPNFRALLTAVRRVVGQQDGLLLDLQTRNALAPEVRREFIETISDLAECLEAGQYDRLKEATQRARRFFR